MPTTTNPRIDRARSIVERELTRIEDERRAFDRFVDRLSQIELPAGHPDDGAARQSGRLRFREPPAGHACEQIETAYRETVMSTPHYEADYGRSFDEDVAAEFGADVAHVVVSADQLGPAGLRTIRQAAEQSREERADFRAVLEEERASLEAIDDRLGEIESRCFAIDGEPVESRPFDRLRNDREQLLDFERACEDLASSRQDEIHDRSRGPIAGIGDTAIVTYLYVECEATCPALADVVAVHESVLRSRRRVERALSGRR